MVTTSLPFRLFILLSVNKILNFKEVSLRVKRQNRGSENRTYDNIPKKVQMLYLNTFAKIEYY